MIRCMKIEQYGKAVNEAVCYLFADTKEEVVDGATIDNMPSGYTLAMVCGARRVSQDRSS